MSALDPLTPEQLAAHFFECQDPQCQACLSGQGNPGFGPALMAQLKANIDATEARKSRDEELFEMLWLAEQTDFGKQS